MAMMDKETAKIANELFDKAKSNIEAPLIGGIYTPVCMSCLNHVDRENPWKKDSCKVYGEIPKEYSFAESADCPHYQLIPNCPKHRLPSLDTD